MIAYGTYLAVVRRWWWAAALVFLATLGIALVLAMRAEKVYRSSVSLVVVPNDSVSESDDYIRSLDTLDRRSIIATLSEIPETRRARVAAQERMGGTSDLRYDHRVHTSVLPNTNILRIDVEGPDPDTAADYANALGTVTRESGSELYRIFDVLLLEEARPRSRPVRPDVRRILTVALILGALLGIVSAFVLETLARPSTPQRS